MNITFEKTTAGAGLITLNVAKDDYAPEVKKQIAQFCRTANLRGFRKGHVPTAVAQKMVGTEAKLSAVNHTLETALFNYIRENKMRMLGSPMQHEGAEPQDIEKQDDFVFQFDIAIVPEFELELTSADHVPYYDIEVAEADVEEEIGSLKQRLGRQTEVDTYEENDILRGIVAELGADGAPLEGGLQNEAAMIMPRFIKAEDQKALFAGVKKNDVITFNPGKAYADAAAEFASLLNVKQEELEGHKESDYSFQVNEISRYMPAEMGQEFFDQVFGEGAVKPA